MKKSLLFSFVLVFCFVTGQTQNKKVKTGNIPDSNVTNVIDSAKIADFKRQKTLTDSLTNAMAKAKQDTNKFNLLKKIWEITFDGQHEEPMIFVCANQLLNLANKLNYTKGKGIAYFALGTVYKHIDKSDSAILFYKEAEKYSLLTKDYNTLMKVYSDMSWIYKSLSDFPKSLEMTLLALKIAEKIGAKKTIANCYNALGNLYSAMGDNQQSIPCYKKSLKYRLQLGIPLYLSHSYFNLGSSYYAIDKYDSARYYLDKGFVIQTDLKNDVGQAYTYDVYALISIKEGDFTKALKYLNKAEPILKRRAGITDEVLECKLAYGNAYLGIKNWTKSEEYFTEAKNISFKNKMGEYLVRAYLGLSKTFEEKGKIKDAFTYFKLYKYLSDSTFNVQNLQKVSTLQQQFEFDKRENSMKEAEVKKEFEHIEEIKKQRIILWSVVFGLLLVILFAINFFFSLKKSQTKNMIIENQKITVELKKQQIDEAYNLLHEKNKEVMDSIHYAKRIQTALMPREKYIDNVLKRLKKND